MMRNYNIISRNEKNSSKLVILQSFSVLCYIFRKWEHFQINGSSSYFFLLFPFLLFTKSHVLNLRVGRSCDPLLQKAYCLVQLINEYSQVTSQILMRDSWVEVTIHTGGTVGIFGCLFQAIWLITSLDHVNKNRGVAEMAPFTFLVVVVWYFRYCPLPIKIIHKKSVWLVSGIHFTSDIFIIKKNQFLLLHITDSRHIHVGCGPDRYCTHNLLYLSYYVLQSTHYMQYEMHAITHCANVLCWIWKTTKNSRVHCGKKWKCIPQPNAGVLTSGGVKVCQQICNTVSKNWYKIKLNGGKKCLKL